MITRLTQWHPREGLSRDEALRYWTEQHAKLVLDVPGLRGYVQNVCTLAPDGSEPPYAGLGEVWFESVQAAEDASGSAEWAAVIEDARTFMDFSRLVVAWAEEVRVLPAA